MTFVRECRRHRARCTDGPAGEVMCPAGHEVGENAFDVVRLKDGHVAIPGGNGMKTITSRKFRDEQGNTLFLRLTTSKRVPYVLRVQQIEGEDGKPRNGILAGAGDEVTAMTKLDELVDKALERGWTEVLGRGAEALTDIPAAAVKRGRPAAVAGGGGGN